MGNKQLSSEELETYRKQLEPIALQLYQEEENKQAEIVYSRVSPHFVNGYPTLVCIIATIGARKYPEDIKKDDRLLKFCILQKKKDRFVLNHVAFKTEDQEALWLKVFEVKKKPEEKLRQIRRLQHLITKSLSQLKITDLFEQNTRTTAMPNSSSKQP